MKRSLLILFSIQFLMQVPAYICSMDADEWLENSVELSLIDAGSGKISIERLVEQEKTLHSQREQIRDIYDTMKKLHDVHRLLEEDDKIKKLEEKMKPYQEKLDNIECALTAIGDLKKKETEKERIATLVKAKKTNAGMYVITEPGIYHVKLPGSQYTINKPGTYRIGVDEDIPY